MSAVSKTVFDSDCVLSVIVKSLKFFFSGNEEAIVHDVFMKSNQVMGARKKMITSFGLIISCTDTIEDNLKIYFEECIETFILHGIWTAAVSYKDNVVPNNFPSSLCLTRPGAVFISCTPYFAIIRLPPTVFGTSIAEC